jgi:exonuclease SbcC
LEESETALAAATADATGARAAARQAAVAAGFTDERAAADATLSEAEIQTIAAAVEAYERERSLCERRIGELEQQLAGARVAQHQSDAAETAVGEARDGLERARITQAEAVGRIARLRAEIERAEALRAELTSGRTQFGLYQTLAQDLRNDRFQAFLLDETFRDLVAGASERLWDLTGRYRLAWERDEFQVVDHDNARQPRSADTLSGGETFLASLALALQLSDQVQKAAGTAPLNSLFIDEGFGTLDREALDAAAGAIETLPKGGRTVGIISHIEELSLRLPARVRVGKTPAGSHLTVEAG